MISFGLGKLLGLDDWLEIPWVSYRQMCWSSLLETIFTEVFYHGPPDTFIIYRGNNLPDGKDMVLLRSITSDVQLFRSLFCSEFLSCQIDGFSQKNCLQVRKEACRFLLGTKTWKYSSKQCHSEMTVSTSQKGVYTFGCIAFVTVCVCVWVGWLVTDLRT